MNVASAKGVYALLLGSGISSGAGILTGWGVTLDLTRKLAASAGSDAEPDPVAWYQSEYGRPPQYSNLLAELAPTPDERRALLEGYFEPTPDEREQGIKTPTDAHRAIARLVAQGWVRVVVTTNFDRLLELSLEEVGVTPLVIATADQAKGATPLAHNKCTVIKVHGDYLDPRIKNSEEELATYDPPMNDLLDQVFDEYGLVVCGWSGESDGALRDALSRCKSRRYTTYWCTRGELRDEVKAVAESRAARRVTISDANSFFLELEERVTSIQATGQRHPMDTRAAVETLKRYLPEERHRIRLRELARDATEELVSHLNEENFSVSAQRTDEEIAARILRLNTLSERTIALVANGCFWGSSEHDDVWVAAVRRLAEFEARNPAANRWGYMFRYPALLALYAAGVTAIGAGRYELLSTLLLLPVRSQNGVEREAIVQSLSPYDILPNNAAQLLLPDLGPGQKHPRPRSNYFHHALRQTVSELIPAQGDFDDAFDRFEYLANLVESDLESRKYDSLTAGHRWFDRRDRGSWFQSSRIASTVQREVEARKEQWPPLRAGLFDKSMDRLVEVKRSVDEATAKYRS